MHLALPEPEPLHPLGQLRPTASVLLRLRAPLPLPATDLALLVARAVPGLDAADVAVVSTPFVDAAPTAAGGAELTSPPAWLLPALISLCVALLGACMALLTALRARRRPEPSLAKPPETAGRRSFRVSRPVKPPGGDSSSTASPVCDIGLV